jgi:hypothetical protein
MYKKEAWHASYVRIEAFVPSASRRVPRTVRCGGEQISAPMVGLCKPASTNPTTITIFNQVQSLFSLIGGLLSPYNEHAKRKRQSCDNLVYRMSASQATSMPNSHFGSLRKADSATMQCSREWPCNHCQTRKVAHLCQFGVKKIQQESPESSIRSVSSSST